MYVKETQDRRLAVVPVGILSTYWPLGSHNIASTCCRACVLSALPPYSVPQTPNPGASLPSPPTAPESYKICPFVRAISWLCLFYSLGSLALSSSFSPPHSPLMALFSLYTSDAVLSLISSIKSPHPHLEEVMSSFSFSIHIHGTTIRI